MKEILKKIILENQFLEIDLVERDFIFPKTNKIVSLIGPRRVGKSYLLFQKMKEIDKKRILYLNFEDERMLPIETKDFDLILESYFELYPDLKPVIFFDEIQELDNWEKFVRRIYDGVTKEIFLTGSSAKLLSKEIATELRGRSLSFFIYPLSFKEFLRFNKTSPVYTTRGKSKIIKSFNDYISFGGFPEILSEDLKIETLRSYLDLTIYRDLVERYKVRNTNLLKNLIKFLITNTGRDFSANSYYKIVKQKEKISKDSISEYVSYIEDIGLMSFVPKYSFSLKEQQVNPKKAYVNDTGFFSAISFSFSENFGWLLETIVLIQLKRQAQTLQDIYYFKDNKTNSECDFLIKDRGTIVKAIQVSKSIKNEKTKDREIKGLLEAMNKFKLKEGLILTYDEEDILEIEKKKIIVKPIWKWLLE
ncbi:MAG: ATP-binding protein [Bacteroidales bacterium]|jgi:predicted AAA+ superfamily ATPase|nr:ATP-binding protein [Bacteroidales bacterium]